MKIQQLELVQVKPDYSKYKRELPEQKELSDLPLFDLESQQIEQTNLFNQ